MVGCNLIVAGFISRDRWPCPAQQCRNVVRGHGIQHSGSSARTPCPPGMLDGMSVSCVSQTVSPASWERSRWSPIVGARSGPSLGLRVHTIGLLFHTVTSNCFDKRLWASLHDGSAVNTSVDDRTTTHERLTARDPAPANVGYSMAISWLPLDMRCPDFKSTNSGARGVCCSCSGASRPWSGVRHPLRSRVRYDFGDARPQHRPFSCERAVNLRNGNLNLHPQLWGCRPRNREASEV